MSRCLWGNCAEPRTGTSLFCRCHYRCACAARKAGALPHQRVLSGMRPSAVRALTAPLSDARPARPSTSSLTGDGRWTCLWPGCGRAGRRHLCGRCLSRHAKMIRRGMAPPITAAALTPEDAAALPAAWEAHRKVTRASHQANAYRVMRPPSTARCIADGCDQTATTRRLCGRHYAAVCRQGRLDAFPRLDAAHIPAGEGVSA